MANQKYDLARAVQQAYTALQNSRNPYSGEEIQNAYRQVNGQPPVTPEAVAAAAAQDVQPATATPTQEQQAALQPQQAQVRAQAAQQAAAVEQAQQQAAMPALASMAGQGFVQPPTLQAPQVQAQLQAPAEPAPLQPMPWANRGAYSDIYAAKLGYDMAQDDATRQMYHNQAEATRAAMQKYGIDDISAGMSADQLHALLEMDNRMGVTNAMQGVTSNEYFEQQYAALRQAGVSDRRAVAEAARRAGEYQSKRVRDLTNAYYMYGVNGNGEINQNGAAILNLIYDEQPTAAAMGQQNYATPIQQWKFGKNMEAQREAFREKLGILGKEGDIKGMLMDKQIAGQLQALLQQGKNAEALALIQQATQKYVSDNQLTGTKYAADAGLKLGKGGALSKISSSSGGGSSSSGGQKISDAETVLKRWDKWKADNPDKPDWMNPYNDGRDTSEDTMNGGNPLLNVDVDNYYSMQSFATKVLEKNAREGYPMGPEELASMIAAPGGYGPQVAQELMDDGTLGRYGREQ